MNAESKTDAPKRKIISIPFLLIAVVLVVGGYPGGKWVMEQVMTLQEKNKAAGIAIPPEEEVDPSVRFGMDARARNMGDPPDASEGQQGEDDGAQRGNRGGGFDPDAIFARRDADSNGKLEGEEISERMQGRIEQMDADKDGAISKEEFLAAMQNRRGGGGEGGQPRRRPDRDDDDGDKETEEPDNDDAENGEEKTENH